MKRTILFAGALALTLAACTSDNDRCATASNPAECRKWSESGGSVDDYLVGGMIGYMLANRGGQTVIVQDPGYHGAPRRLRTPIMAPQRQIARAQQKIQRQRAELRQQQAANTRLKRENAALRSDSKASSRKSWSSSYRSSSSSRRRSGK